MQPASFIPAAEPDRPAVDRDPEFRPWRRAARIVRREGGVFHADPTIGFKGVRRVVAAFEARARALYGAGGREGGAR